MKCGCGSHHDPAELLNLTIWLNDDGTPWGIQYLCPDTVGRGSHRTVRWDAAPAALRDRVVREHVEKMREVGAC